MLHGLMALFFSGMLVVGMAALAAVLVHGMPAIRAALRMKAPAARLSAQVPSRVRLVSRTRSSVVTPPLRAAA